MCKSFFPFFFILLGIIEAIWGLGQLYGVVLSHHSQYLLTGSFYNPGPERTVQLRDMHLYDVKRVLTLDTARTYTLRGWDNDMQRPFVMQGDSVVYY